MQNSRPVLSTDVSVLVEHVELHRSGWREKSLQRLILATIWIAKEPRSVAAIQTTLQDTFHLSESVNAIRSAISVLESHNMVVCVSNDNYRIPDEQHAILEAEIIQAENIVTETRQYFCSLLQVLNIQIDPDEGWSIFETEFITPLIKSIGASAYNLIAGQPLSIHKHFVDHYLKRYDQQFHRPLSDLIPRFLEPKNQSVRKYVSRLLHATFCVEAYGLPKDVLDHLHSKNKQISFQFFVDTNFLFSLLELHENPSNEAAKELQDVVSRLKGNPRVDLFVTPRTIEEAKHAISLAKADLYGFPAGIAYAKAGLRVGMSGMTQRYLQVRSRTSSPMSPEDWFNPYLENFISLARSKGVELYNEKLDDLAMRQDVIDDITLVQQSEVRRNGRAKTYDMIEHDMILWHHASDRRPAYVESPIDANFWILTVDFRLIAFDIAKRRENKSKVPICLHPTSLIQLLQFWVPRDTDFEEAILGSMRLPFLFQEFDAEGERTSLRILKGVGRFRDSEGLSEDAVTNIVLDDGLRSRISQIKHNDEELNLIRDSILETMKELAASDRAAVEKLKLDLTLRDAKVLALEGETTHKIEEIASLTQIIEEQKRLFNESNQLAERHKSQVEQLRTDLRNEQLKSETAKREIANQGNHIDALSAKLSDFVDKDRRTKARDLYLVILAAIFAFSVGVPWFVKGTSTVVHMGTVIDLPIILFIAAMVVFISLHLCLELICSNLQPFNQLWIFRQVCRFRAWLWSFVILGLVLGLFLGLYTNRIQSKLDSSSPSSGSKSDLRHAK